MMKFLVAILMLQSLSVVATSSDLCNKLMSFSTTIESKVLLKHTFKSLITIDDMGCQSHCFRNKGCISYSYDKLSLACNLSDSDHLLNPGDFVDLPGAMYRRADNDCNCLPVAKCRVNFVDDSFWCQCNIPGFTGADCSININECASSPCRNGATCHDGVDKYTCQCKPGYTGTHCQININECRSSPCLNGGSCQDGINEYTCQCVTGWLGQTCHIKDYCAASPCQNGGSCSNTAIGHTCSCTSNYYGSNCQYIKYCEVYKPNCPWHKKYCQNKGNSYECTKTWSLFGK